MRIDHSFQDKLRNLLAWFLDVRSVLLDQEGEHRPRELAEHIACDYRSLKVAKGHTTKVIKVVPQIGVGYFRTDVLYRRPVKKLFDLVNGSLATYISHFYLHGSLATEDYKKGWSDLDTFMVVKKDVVTDSKKLLELRDICFSAWPLFLEITPLQHHGFLVATEFDLKSYPSNVMPPEVLDQAFAMKRGQHNLTLFLRKERSNALKLLRQRFFLARDSVKEGVFKYHPHKGVYLAGGFNKAEDNMHQLMSFLGNVANVPIYFLDAIGKSCYKGESFSLARSYFSSSAWSLVDKASRVRELWPEKEGQKYRGNRIPPWVQGVIGPKYFEENLVLFREAFHRAKKIAS